MLVKRWLAVLVAGAVLTAAAVSALVLQGSGSTAVATDRGAAVRRRPTTTRPTPRPRDDQDGRGDVGPPPWAHGRAKAKGHGPGKAWKELSPAQRSDLMKRLTTQHAQGMKAFGECVQAGRSDCEKPLPPGLAKRL